MEICTKVNLDEANLDELIEALNYQARQNKEYWVKCKDQWLLWDLIRLLESLGCPQDVIERLDAWDREHVLNQTALDRWHESCEQWRKSS